MVELPGRPDRDAVALWAPVVAVAAVASSGVGLEQPWTGSDLGLALTALLLAGPLAARRRHPQVAALLVAAALGVQVAVGGSLHFGAFVAVLVAAWAVGRWTTRPRDALAGGVLLLAGALGASARGLAESPGEVLFPIFYVAAAVALGRGARHLATQADDLRRLNAALERERDTAARLAVATERLRLSRDLHDSVAHTLTVTVVQAELAESTLADDPLRAREAMVRIQEAGRRGLADLRGTLRVLRSADDAPGGTLDDLEALAAVVSAAGTAVTLGTVGEPAEVPPALSADLFRVAQEALTNVARHSAADRARVEVRWLPAAVELGIDDPGPAIAARGSGSGSGEPVEPSRHGLRGMRERLAAYAGEVAAGPTADGGWSVRARVPLAPTILPESEAAARA